MHFYQKESNLFYFCKLDLIFCYSIFFVSIIINIYKITNFILTVYCQVPGIEDPGLQPDEYEASVNNLKFLASQLDAHCTELNRRKVNEGISGHCLIRKRLSEQDFLEIRYSIIK